MVYSHFSHLLSHLCSYFSHLSALHTLDFWGSLLAFIATIYYVRAHIFAWLLSLAAISINVLLYWRKGIYGDMGLQFVYFGMIIYGWWQWLHGNKCCNTAQRQALPISHIKPITALFLSIGGLLGIIGGSCVLRLYTNSQVPYWDAVTTVLSLTAQWLMCRKIIETWILWFVVDALYAGLYVYKGIPIHAVLQFIYLVMAFAGYINWIKNFKLIKVSRE